jgi:amino acid adenylation domain-containing protein
MSINTVEQSSVLFPAEQISDNLTQNLDLKQPDVPDNKINLFNDPVLFWKRQLASGVPRLEMPTDFPRSRAETYDTRHITFTVARQLVAALKQNNESIEGSLHTILLTVYNVLLFRYTGQTEIVIGLPDIECRVDETGGFIDAHHHTKVFHIQFANDIRFIDLLAKVNQLISEYALHPDVSYQTLLGAFNADFENDRSCLYNLIFSYRNALIGSKEIDYWSANVSVPENARHSIDIALYIKDTADDLNITLTYNSALFKAESMQLFARHFEVLLEAIIINPLQDVAKLPLLCEAELTQLTSVWNTSAVNYPDNKCVHELFEQQVAINKNANALMFENEGLTYGYLNECANRLAHYLQNHGVKAGVLVPVCVDPSPEMIIAILGILKAGAAYVPMDADYPADRIAYLLEDTAAQLVICNDRSKIKLQAFKNVSLLSLGGDDVTQSYPTDNLNIDVKPGDLAYVIYTSGTTGKPKGVMIEHRALIDHCYGVIESAGLDICKSFALFSPLVFDAGHSIIHSCLLTGGCLHLLPKSLIVDSERVTAYLNDNEIDCIKIVPSLWLSYAGTQQIALPVKVIIFGGEAFPLSVLNYLQRLNYKGNVYNHYGPTEVTIGKCIHKVNLDAGYHTVPIGKPFSNTQLYVLDDHMQVVPVGIAGELYVAGAGLARGYLNLPGLTAEKFVDNPFSTGVSGRMYKTGDKVKWLPDGNIEYLGRCDEQIKINGYRIEPAEIEDALLQSGQVSHAIVLAIADDKGHSRLVQYIVPNPSFNKDTLLAFLRKKLPAYMIPVSSIELMQLPLTKNGKVDKKQLTCLAAFSKEYTAPVGSIEIKLTRIWETVLNSSKIGVHDNFFELGGNSILAAMIFAKVKHSFHKCFPLSTIFSAPTVHLMAGMLIDTIEKEQASKIIIPIQPRGHKVPLFCVHAGHGHVLFYGNLALHLGNDQPLYGIQAKGIDGTDLPFSKMEDMAAHYIDEIRKIQPEGPYHLAGYCLGALITFEMARQLLSQGQQVALLANFNGISPYYHRPVIHAATNSKEQPGRFEKIRRHLNNIKKLKGSEKVDYVSQRLWVRVKSKVIGPLFKFNFKMLGTIFKLFLVVGKNVPDSFARRYTGDSLYLLQCKYRPQAYQGDMVVFRSPDIYPDPYLGWQALTTGQIKTIDIPGEHETRRDIMNDPYVQYLAKELEGLLPG